MQRNGLLGSDSAVTSSFGNVFDFSFNNSTRLETQEEWTRQMSYVSVDIFIYRLNEHRVIFLAWKAHLVLQPPKIPLFGYGTETQWVLSLSYVCPQAGSVSGKVNGAFSGAKRAIR